MTYYVILLQILMSALVVGFGIYMNNKAKKKKNETNTFTTCGRCHRPIRIHPNETKGEVDIYFYTAGDDGWYMTLDKSMHHKLIGHYKLKTK